MQVTKDHTKAMELLDDDQINLATYHVHPGRLEMTSGMGIVKEPKIQTFSGKIKDDDLILMTTDGIHYALQPTAMSQIVLESANCSDATLNLIDAAKNIIKYPDNMSATINRR